MLQSEFLTRNKRAYDRRILMERIAHALGSLVMTVFFTLVTIGFFILMVTADREEFLFWGLFACGVLSTIGAIYFLLRTLDDTFYPAHSNHRITGRRR